MGFLWTAKYRACYRGPVDSSCGHAPPGGSRCHPRTSRYRFDYCTGFKLALPKATASLTSWFSLSIDSNMCGCTFSPVARTITSSVRLTARNSRPRHLLLIRNGLALWMTPPNKMGVTVSRWGIVSSDLAPMLCSDSLSAMTSSTRDGISNLSG